MNIILFDIPGTKTNLLPFTYTRPVSEIRIGILTIKEKWERWLTGDYSYLTDDYLSAKYPQHTSFNSLYLNGSVLPDADLVLALKSLKANQILKKDNILIAFYGNIDSLAEIDSADFNNIYEEINYPYELISIQHGYEIFIKNGTAIRSDFDLLTKGRKSQAIEDPHTITYNKQDIFIDKNVKIKASILNAENGPIYVGSDAEIGEGSIVKGATSIGEGAVLNLGTKIRGDATIGPYCKVGGEISNSVIFGFSSKAHEGFLGNSVIGEWCNLGANTNVSNLKNDYKLVRVWNYGQERFAETGRQFCGLLMGDHSKSGISTMFNTGTVVGVSSNIYGAGFPRAFIPSFSWGGAQGFITYKVQHALKVIPKVYERRKKILTKEDEALLKHIFEVTKKFRRA